MTKKILIANGVNLDLLGLREPQIYGTESLSDLEKFCRDELKKYEKHFSIKVNLEFFQTNSECDFLNKISEVYDGMVINAAAWSHTSLAIYDRVKGLKLKFVEVHLSNLASREEIRQKSYLSPLALGVIYGFGTRGYSLAILGLLQEILAKKVP